MTFLQAIVLGLIQGVTEFLPVSSSAHLILTSKWLGWPDQGLAFDMAAHSGSLLAIIVTLRHELGELVVGVGDLVRGRRGPRATLAAQVAIASVPVLLTGWWLQGFVAAGGRSALTLGLTSLIFGWLLLIANRLPARPQAAEPWPWRTVLQVGLAQALAIIPGTSRSGVTMTAGLFSGMSRDQAARLSFLLSVPVGLVVAAKDGWDLSDLSRAGGEPIAWAALGVGFVTAALSAYLAIGWLLRWLRRRGFRLFAWYRIVLGGVLLLMVLL